MDFIQEQQNRLMSPVKSVILASSRALLRSCDKNKGISIGMAITLISTFWIKWILSPPKNLRHIPHISYYVFLKSLINGETIVERSKRLRQPFMKKNNSNIYLEPGQNGWSVIVANPEDAKKVFLKQDLFPKAAFSSKGANNTLFGKLVAGPNITQLSGNRWKMQRMVVNPAFHRSMPVKVFGNLTLDLFALMEELGTKNLEMNDLIQRFALESIGKTGFGFDFNCLINRSKGEWVSTYQAIREGLNEPIYFFMPVLEHKLLFLNPGRKEVHRKLDDFEAMINSIIEHKKASIAAVDKKNSALTENEEDLLTLMIKSGLKGEGALSNEELQSNVMTFFLAGHDTTTSSLLSAIYFLAKHQDIQERARAEVINILGDESMDILPSVEDTKKMTYINQVIKETLRLIPPSPKIFSRVAAEDTELSGQFIPKGALINVDLYDIQRSEVVWKHPDEFNPDRFADEGENNTHNPWTWLPFGGGSRQCVGMKYSLTQQKVVLSMMLRKYNWSLHGDDVVISGFPIIQPKELRIDFSKRY